MNADAADRITRERAAREVAAWIKARITRPDGSLDLRFPVSAFSEQDIEHIATAAVCGWTIARSEIEAQEAAEPLKEPFLG